MKLFLSQLDPYKHFIDARAQRMQGAILRQPEGSCCLCLPIFQPVCTARMPCHEAVQEAHESLFADLVYNPSLFHIAYSEGVCKICSGFAKKLEQE